MGIATLNSKMSLFYILAVAISFGFIAEGHPLDGTYTEISPEYMIQQNAAYDKVIKENERFSSCISCLFGSAVTCVTSCLTGGPAACLSCVTESAPGCLGACGFSAMQDLYRGDTKKPNNYN